MILDSDNNIFNRFWNNLRIFHSNSECRSISDPTISDIDSKNKMAWVWSTLKTAQKTIFPKSWIIKRGYMIDESLTLLYVHTSIKYLNSPSNFHGRDTLAFPYCASVNPIPLVLSDATTAFSIIWWLILVTFSVTFFLSSILKFFDFGSFLYSPLLVNVILRSEIWSRYFEYTNITPNANQFDQGHLGSFENFNQTVYYTVSSKYMLQRVRYRSSSIVYE